ncbi:1-deoxy-D-xylulose-5-phosphate reductoisomerase, partial [Escherichia coli]|nr:1-deoxy-D-xylulose-5-phosphate reductoisomerase [Escherichia coli]
RIDGPAKRLDLAALGNLTFEEPDLVRFPALRLAIEAMAIGGRAPCVLNAANEIAVEAFLAGRIRFGAITGIVE